MTQKWFKAKNYGWGWTPATWQGWLIVAIYFVIIIKRFMIIDIRSHSGSDTLLNWVPELILYTFILILICYFTGEKPSWRWGTKNKK